MNKRKMYLFLFLLIPGLCAGILRGMEMAYYYDWTTGLFGYYRAEFILPMLVIITVIVLAFLSSSFPKKMKRYCIIWKTRTVGGLAAGIFSALMLTAAGLARMSYSMRNDRKAFVVFGVITVLTGIVFLLLSVVRYTGKMPEAARLFSPLPVFWSCFLLILTYIENPVEPVLRTICYDVFAVCFVVLAVFYEIAPIFTPKSRRRTVFFTVGAIYLIIITLMGRLFGYFFSGDVRNLTDAPIRILMLLAIGIRLVQNALCLMKVKLPPEKTSAAKRRPPEKPAGKTYIGDPYDTYKR